MTVKFSFLVTENPKYRVAEFATLFDERMSRSKIVNMDKELCVRKFGRRGRPGRGAGGEGKI